MQIKIRFLTRLFSIFLFLTISFWKKKSRKSSKTDALNPHPKQLEEGRPDLPAFEGIILKPIYADRCGQHLLSERLRLSA